MTYQTTSKDVQEMFGEIAGRYDLTNTVLSGGVHLFWKKRFVRDIPRDSAKQVLDLCCGTGDLVPILSNRYSTTVTGGDFCEPMLEVARKRFAEKKEYVFIQCDALSLPYPENTLDVVTVAFGVRNFEKLEVGLSEIYRVLKPGGIIAILEFGQPRNKLFAALYGWYSRWIMPIIGWMVTGNKAAYEYLPRTAARFPCGEAFKEVLGKVGFKKAQVVPYTFGIAYAYYASK